MKKDITKIVYDAVLKDYPNAFDNIHEEFTYELMMDIMCLRRRDLDYVLDEELDISLSQALFDYYNYYK